MGPLGIVHATLTSCGGADLQRGQASRVAHWRWHAGAHTLVVASARVHTSVGQLVNIACCTGACQVE